MKALGDRCYQYFTRAGKDYPCLNDYGPRGYHYIAKGDQCCVLVAMPGSDVNQGDKPFRGQECLACCTHQPQESHHD